MFIAFILFQVILQVALQDLGGGGTAFRLNAREEGGHGVARCEVGGRERGIEEVDVDAVGVVAGANGGNGAKAVEGVGPAGVRRAWVKPSHGGGVVDEE